MKKSLIIVSVFLVLVFLSVGPSPAEVIRWRGQNTYPGIGVGKAAEKTVKWIKEITGGRLVIDLVAAPGLVPVGESFNAVSRGVIDCIMPHYGAAYASQVPEAAIQTGPPFAWENVAEAYDCYYHRGLYEILNAVHAKYNVFWIPQIQADIRFLGTSFPCYGIDDLKGKKIRAVGTDAKYITKLCASAVSIPGPELYTAMKLGTVDGCIYSLSSINVFADIWPYYVVSPNYGGDVGCFLFNLDSWKALPDDIRTLLERELKYQILASSIYNTTIRLKYCAEAQAKYGTKFITWSDEDKAKAIEAGMSFYDELAEISPAAAEAIDIIKLQMREFGKLE